MSSFRGWKILHLALEEGIPALPADPEYQGIYVVFWWQGAPLGHHWVLAAQLPMPATQLATLATKAIAPTIKQFFEQSLQTSASSSAKPTLQSLLALEKPLAQLTSILLPLHPTSHLVSVIVPTRNRPDPLARCLQSLRQQSYLPHEILVVDNAPDSDVTQQLIAQMPDVQYVLEPEPGASKARNTGIQKATGDILVFIDDDMTAHPDWILRLQQTFHNPEVMAVTGLVFPGELATEAQYIFEKFWGFNRGYCRSQYGTKFFERTKSWATPVWQLGGSGNMAIRRSTIDRIGDFDERLGSGSKAAGCSEDSEFLYRLLAEKLICCYEPTAVAYHYHRADMPSLQKQAYGYMRGHVAALLIQFEKYRHWGNLRRIALTLPKHYATFLIGGLLRGFSAKHATLLAEISGCFSGIGFYLQNRHRSE